MKKISCILTFILFVLIGCKQSQDESKEGAGEKFVGEWQYENSKMMGGYRISGNYKLFINKTGPGKYGYKFELTIIDYMYGGHPKKEYSSGKLDSILTDEFKWKFTSGDFANRGGYIFIEDDVFQGDKKPDDFSVHFNEGEGDILSFKRIK
jgi:hypothetical protein